MTSEDTHDKTVSLQTGVHRGNEKLEQFKLLMNWNQEELEQWATASKQKEEDNLALEKYRRADEARVRELNQAIEKMTKAVHAKRTELENEVTDTQTAQIELDRAAEDFRALHAERPLTRPRGFCSRTFAYCALRCNSHVCFGNSLLSAL